MIFSDKEIAQRVEAKLFCALESARKDNVMPTNQNNSRAVIRHVGFRTMFWDYRRRRDGSIHSIYLPDYLLINTQTTTGDQKSDLRKELKLTANVIQYIDLGLQGNYFDDYEPSHNSPIYNLCKLIFTVGKNLRARL